MVAEYVLGSTGNKEPWRASEKGHDVIKAIIEKTLSRCLRPLLEAHGSPPPPWNFRRNKMVNCRFCIEVKQDEKSSGCAK